MSINGVDLFLIDINPSSPHTVESISIAFKRSDLANRLTLYTMAINENTVGEYMVTPSRNDVAGIISVVMNSFQ
jgi:hypothetical protein